MNYLGHKTLLLAAVLVTAPLGCGEDPGSYDREILTMENPISVEALKANADENTELSLGSNEASDFHFLRYGAAIPWSYPLFDYYRYPIPVPVPLSPGFVVTDWMHPFYALYLDPFSPFGDDDDDHHGRFRD